MFRYLILPTLAALVLVPDWASAFFRRRPAVCVAPPPARVQYYGPVCYPVAPAPPCPAMFAPPVYVAPAVVIPPAPNTAPPRVTPERATAPKTPEVAPNPKPSLTIPPPPNLIPNGTSELPPPRAVEVVPPPVAPVTAVEEKVPPPNVPLTPFPPPAKDTAPAPIPAMPTGVFDPAPPVIPAPTVPKLETKPAETKPDAPALPKFELPPLVDPPLAQPKTVESKASPIRDGAKDAYELFPTDGPAPVGPDAKRIVTFHNFTGRDVLLTVDEKMLTLPAKHTITGTVGAKFKMQVGVDDAVELTVPAAAPGADVVLKK